MANTIQAKKRIIQSERHRKHNVSLRSLYRTHIKKVLGFIGSGKKDEALAALKVAVPVLDRMVNKKIMHKNKAARHKSRLNVQIKKMANGKG